jgi:hypothetical protein
MHDHDDETVPAPNAEQMASLGESLAPRAAVEERVVAALRAKGVLRDAHAATIARSTAARSVVRVGVMLAAACALFIAGTITGERRAESRVASTVAVDGAAAGTHEVALQIQQTALDYAALLSRIDAADDVSSVVAMQSFRSVADEIVRIAPQSGFALAMQVAFPRSYTNTSAGIASVAQPSHLIWY